jgi:pimeloyl-ACP methyl ester carboxylesterase
LNDLIQKKEYKFKGSLKRIISADLTYSKYNNSVPIVVFVHGFMGFKDWGAWPLAAEIFAIKGLPFFKFNFSHNGTSPENLSEFVDLEAFGNNNFKHEFDDLGIVFDFITNKSNSFYFDWNGQFHLIGHSRGGAISLLRSAQDDRISKCSTWSAVSDLERYLELKEFKEWQETGVHTIVNQRTKQEMPIYFQFVQAYAQHATQLSLSKQFENISCPLLIVHGENDKSVPISDAHTIYQNIPHSILLEIENSDHTFNCKHPLEERKISRAFAEVITETIAFFDL